MVSNEATLPKLTPIELTKLAQALYEPGLVPDPAAFEADPPRMDELIADVVKLAGPGAATVAIRDDFEVAQRIVFSMNETPQGRAALSPVLDRIRRETMSSPMESIVLSVILIVALRDLLRLEIDNQGSGGRWRWRFRIGGPEGAGEPTDEVRRELRHWLGTLAGKDAGVRVFVCSAPEDEKLREMLLKHLAPMEGEGIVRIWHDGMVPAGADRAGKIAEELERARLILPLLSASLLGSDQHQSTLERALERGDTGNAPLIPVLLRPCDWENTRFGRLQALPKEGKAVVDWSSRDEAFTAIVKELREVVLRLS